MTTQQPLPPLSALAHARAGQTFIPVSLLGTDGTPAATDDPRQPPRDAALVARVGERLDGFAEALTPHERAALHALIDLASPDAPFTLLGATPPDAILDARERAVFEQLQAEPAPESGGLRPLMVMIMKATRLCNLRCTYCNQWRDGPNQIMSFPILARAIRDVLRAPGVRRVEFVWHGGEATLLPIAFLKKALWLQQRFRQPGQVIDNLIQTNATRLTDEWLEFWRRYRFSVGVSLDGPPEIHDRRRVDVAGRPTSARVRAGLERLRAAGIGHGVLLVVDDEIVAAGARRVLDYLLEIGVTHVDLLNVLPKNTPVGAPPEGMYLSWPGYVEFLRDVFRLWWPDYAGRISLRELGGLVQQLTGGPPTSCVFAGNCFGGYLTIDPSGDVSACDKYVDDPDYHFGNLLKLNLADLDTAPRLAAVRSENAGAVDGMRDCPWFSVCNGACPHDRYTSARRRPGSDGTCCGLSPLLAEMTEALRAAGFPVYATADPMRAGSA